jgi:membrane-associated protease RseP (regulator of RpoE activity)
MITALLLLTAVGILVWGLIRARPAGKVGFLAWLQSVVLMAPWLIFFGLFAAGVYLNLAVVLFLMIGSAISYILLGRQLRAIAEREGPNAFYPKTAKTTEEPAASAAPTPQTEPAPEAEAAEQPSMPAEDLQTVKGIFGIDTFFATENIPYLNGVIFKGNLRGEPQPSHERLSASLAERVGDRYRLFLVEGPDGKPVVVVLPGENDPKPTTLPQKILAIVLALATIATSLEMAGLLNNFDFFQNPGRITEIWPLSAGVLAVLVVHEIGHRLLAARYNIRLSPPFFLPTWQIGSFGALTRFESLLPDRNILFDIAFAGPATGGLLALGMLITGLMLSQPSSLFQIPSEFFQGSILVGTLAKVVLGDALQQPLVSIHPLVFIGWLGLVITAINLMPAGQLDGGRIVLSIYGRKIAGRTTVATLIVLGLATLVNPLALYWAILILFLQRDLDRPALNELSEPDDARAALGLLVLFLMATTLLPLTPSLAGRLGIGG